MHPNVFLTSLWRGGLLPQVFVAMSFDPVYDRRFDQVIKPAVESVSINGENLKAFRVDLSKSGDSILTEIMDGIAHSRLVLADVSTAGHDRTSGRAYRNANVLYEVGLALACRQPSEVLLVRDDHDRFLFDVSTIPQLFVEFTAETEAKALLAAALNGRLEETRFEQDARLKMAVATLTQHEKKVIEDWSAYGLDYPFGYDWTYTIGDVPLMDGISRLLDKQIIRAVSRTPRGFMRYVWTPLGLHFIAAIKENLPHVHPPGPIHIPTRDEKDHLP